MTCYISKSTLEHRYLLSRCHCLSSTTRHELQLLQTVRLTSAKLHTLPRSEASTGADVDAGAVESKVYVFHRFIALLLILGKNKISFKPMALRETYLRLLCTKV